MDLPAGPGRLPRVGGLVVAGTGFLLTRVTVAEMARMTVSPREFLLTGLFPLVLGFGLAVYGVALTVSTRPTGYVNTVAAWCVIGVVGMAIILALTLANTMIRGELPPGLLVNPLLWSAVGGTLLGVRSAANRARRRDVLRARDQATLLNRILRHEVLNALTVIRGYLGQVEEDGENARRAIRESADRVEGAVEDVGLVIQGAGNGDAESAIDLTGLLEERIGAARESYPGIEFRIDAAPEARIAGDARLGTVLDGLFRTLAERAPESPTEVVATVSLGADRVRLGLAHDGRLSERQREVLSGPDVGEYEDPSVDFELPLISLLVDGYGGHIEVDPESRVDLQLRRWLPAGEAGQRAGGYGIPPVAIRNALVASVVAGLAMAAVLQGLSGALPVIGALYGFENLVVGGISHLFHSAVFATVFPALLSLSPVGDRSPRVALLHGVAYGASLWLVAAGLVMPFWLTLLGSPAMLPTLTPAGLLGHLIWGATLAAAYTVLPE
ncbi:MAG: hypothetical protein ABEI39_00690 [Halobacteriales archaeon]